MFQPIKIGFGEYISRFYGGLSATTKPMHEFISRGLDKSIAWCPSRMVDSAEEMLAMWQRNDTDDSPTHPAKLPVILVAMAKDYVPTGREYTRQVSDSQFVTLPDDPKERMFGLRYISADIRTQLAIFAADEPTARSIAAQFCLFIDSPHNKTFDASHRFAGFDLSWGVQLESSDTPAMSIQSEAKNLTILALDLTLRASIPMFDHPKDSESNDGKGTDGDIDDPHGYLLVETVDVIAQDLSHNVVSATETV